MKKKGCITQQKCFPSDVEFVCELTKVERTRRGVPPHKVNKRGQTNAQKIKHTIKETIEQTLTLAHITATIFPLYSLLVGIVVYNRNLMNRLLTEVSHAKFVCL
jgi:hypothetical protein